MARVPVKRRFRYDDIAYEVWATVKGGASEEQVRAAVELAARARGISCAESEFVGHVVSRYLMRAVAPGAKEVSHGNAG